MNTVILKNHGFWVGINETVFNSSLIILNCIVYNKCCICEIYFDTKLSKAQPRMIINIYDKDLFYIVLDVFNNTTISLFLRLL